MIKRSKKLIVPMPGCEIGSNLSLIPPNPQRYRCFLVGPTIIKGESKRVLLETKSDPWALYLYAMKSPSTKEKYLLRLGKFLDFADLLMLQESLH